uniref:Uncharacterized protein n=1 Tax=Arundo donax TaxID=35708 RepID=A0A0A8XNJ2_ARUDO
MATRSSLRSDQSNAALPVGIAGRKHCHLTAVNNTENAGGEAATVFVYKSQICAHDHRNV